MAGFRKMLCLALCGMIMTCLLCGCPEKGGADNPLPSGEGEGQIVQPLFPEASGRLVKEGAGVTVDASNLGDGYVMIKSEANDKGLKVNIEAEEGSYYYNLYDDGNYITYPLQMGSGEYTVKIYENVAGDTYASIASWTFLVEMEDKKSVFLYPSQYVDYTSDSAVVVKAAELCKGLDTAEEKVKALYKFVAAKVQYDHAKAKTVKRGYLPSPDDTLQTLTGICMDYAALLAALLRSQGIPASLVIGDVLPEGYLHAWNRAYVNGTWVHMDATLDAQAPGEENYIEERIY